MTTTADQPWWVSWLTPILGLASALFTGVVYVLRRLLIGLVKEELEKKHLENVARFDRLETMLEQSRDDRQKIHQEIQAIQQQKSYEQGLAAGRQGRDS